MAKASRTASRQAPQVFINVPYDADYEPLAVALVGALVTLGLRPVAGLSHSTGTRLERIWEELSRSEYSISDLSRIELSKDKYPRFNMPFEAGLAVALEKIGRGHHALFMDASTRLTNVTTSDLKGYDSKAHKNTRRGVIKVVREMFVRPNSPFSFDDTVQLCRKLQQNVGEIKRRNGLRPDDHIFHRSTFGSLLAGAQTLVADHLAKTAARGSRPARVSP